MAWIIRKGNKDIGTVKYAAPIITMPITCNGVVYIITDVSWRPKVITVKDHPRNAD
jgi:hypothetical protein